MTCRCGLSPLSTSRKVSIPLNYRAVYRTIGQVYNFNLVAFTWICIIYFTSYFVVSTFPIICDTPSFFMFIKINSAQQVFKSFAVRPIPVSHHNTTITGSNITRPLGHTEITCRWAPGINGELLSVYMYRGVSRRAGRCQPAMMWRFTLKKHIIIIRFIVGMPLHDR